MPHSSGTLFKEEMLKQQEAVVIPDTDDEGSDPGGHAVEGEEGVGPSSAPEAKPGNVEPCVAAESERTERLTRFFQAHQQIPKENSTVIGSWDKLQIDSQETQEYSVDESILERMKALSVGPAVVSAKGEACNLQGQGSASTRSNGKAGLGFYNLSCHVCVGDSMLYSMSMLCR